jgi:Ala-tRNA(Pro) deacylase
MKTLTDYLEREGVSYEVLRHHRAYTGIDEARVLGIEADEVLKTIVLDSRGRHVAAVLPSGERIDMALVREVLGDPEASLADEREITHDFGGFELGALPPVAPLLGVETIVDLTVKEHGSVIFAAGTQTESLRVDVAALFATQPVEYVQIAEIWNEGRA